MTRQQATQLACAIVGLSFRSRANYEHPSDGFCDMCPASQAEWNFQNSGHDLKFALDAVKEKLIREGFTPNRDVLHEIDALWKEIQS